MFKKCTVALSLTTIMLFVSSIAYAVSDTVIYKMDFNELVLSPTTQWVNFPSPSTSQTIKSYLSRVDDRTQSQVPYFFIATDPNPNASDNTDKPATGNDNILEMRFPGDSSNIGHKIEVYKIVKAPLLDVVAVDIRAKFTSQNVDTMCLKVFSSTLTATNTYTPLDVTKGVTMNFPTVKSLDWANYSFVFNKSTKTETLYVNGEFVATQAIDDAIANELWTNGVKILWLVHDGEGALLSDGIVRSAFIDYLRYYQPGDMTQYTPKLLKVNVGNENILSTLPINDLQAGANTIDIIFNSAMNPNDLNSSNITFKDSSGVPVDCTGVVNTSGAKYTITTAKPLPYNTSYTLTIGNVTTQTGGVVEGVPKVLSFKTIESDFKSSNLTFTKGTNDVKVEMTIKNLTLTQSPVTVLLVAYKDDEIFDYSFKDYIVQSNSEQNISTTTIYDSSVTSVKAYVWCDLANSIPFAMPFEMGK